ncbi:MAG: hypothetical protein QM538_04935 [Methylacidiphilales bacterium]|nr:hypothetical protein [Candidatus Methylacidiphilales bacterium]
MLESASSLKLFLSVDLVGSTEFKTKHLSENLTSDKDWRSSIVECFERFNRALREHQKSYIELNYNYWKFLGDELIYYVDIKQPQTLVNGLKIFIDTIKEMRKFNPIKELPIKGTAWIAGFPVINMSFRNDYDNNNVGSFDFIGPSIDAGFRISKYSTADYLCITAELAYFLFQYMSKPNSDYHNKNLPLYFYKLENIKGLLEGELYPIYYIEISELQNKFNSMKGSKEANPKESLAYLDELFKSVNNELFFCKPYLLGDMDNVIFGDFPESHKRYIQTMAKELIS